MSHHKLTADGYTSGTVTAIFKMNSNHPETIFVGESEMARLMRSLDWAQTPLGPVSEWAQSLKTSVSILMSSRYPMFVWWGRGYANLYNDAYRPILGAKHPHFLGQSAKDCWASIWDIVGPLADNVLSTGQSTWSENLLLIMDRNGYSEEAYFTFSYSPVRDETGGVGGIFCAVIETTKQVIGERRLRTLRELSASTVAAKTVGEACQLAMATLSANAHDVPFALLYLVDPDGIQAHLVSTTTSIEAGTIASPWQIDLTQNTALWPLPQVIHAGEAQLLEDLTARFGELPGGAWAEFSRSALVMPIARSGQAQQLAGILIVGVSPRQVLDDEYRGFFDLVASHVTTAIANAEAYEAERKRAEALAELDRAKTLFFSNISHEFRTPLTLLLNPLEEVLTNSTSLVPSDRHQLDIAYRNSQRLLKLVNTLLDFSRIEAGRIEAVYEPIDLATLTTDLAAVFRSAIERAGIRFLVNCPPLPEPVYVDREMWEKIILNLLSNAFKFTFEGDIEVSLHWNPSPSSPGAILTVRDTGTGIPTEELPHIFERFHQVRGARGRSYEGSGIGLSLVQELVRLQGGTITVSSVIDQGSCFTVSIPAGYTHLPSESIQANRTLTSTKTGTFPYIEEALRWLPQERESIESWEPQEDGENRTTPSTYRSMPLASAPPAASILLVDDNSDMRDYLQRLLSQHYQVTAVADGRAALDLLRQHQPNLILADVMMPGLDGFALLRELRANPQTQELPVILLSARAGAEAQIEGLAAGADDYLTKPFSARELLARVEASLKLAQLRREATQREQVLRLEAESAKQTADLILSSISDGVSMLDRDWRYTFVNDRLCEMAGKQRDELIGHSIWEVFPEAVETEVYTQLHRAMQEQTPLQFEVHYSPWNRWFEHHLYPFSDRLTVFSTEVTARKQVELVLVEQKRLLELIALGHPLDECLAALCSSVSRLNPGIRACILLADAQRLTFPRSITPDFPTSFGLGLKDAPINELCIGTCGEAVYSGQTVTCADIANDDRWSQGWRDLCISHGILAAHSVPVMNIHNQPLGSLMLCFDEARMPTDWEYQLAMFGTQVASIVLERDLASAVLRESEARYRTLFESIDEGFCIVEVIFDDTEKPIDYRFLIVNPAFEKQTGYNNVVGKTVREVVSQHEEFWFERYGRVALTGESIRVEDRSEGFQGWYEVHAFRVGAPHLRRVGILFNNITERKQAEEELRQKNAILNVINESTPTPIFVKDRQGRIIYANPATLEVFGKPAEAVIGYRDCDLYPNSEDAARIMENDRRIMESGQMEVVEESPDGIRTFLGMKVPYRDQSGGVIGLIGISNDISERVQIERDRESVLQQEQAARQAAEAANRIKDEFLAVLSHELRSPLNPILGWAKLLKNGKLDESKTQQALTAIERNAKLQAELIEDLLDVSRILRGKLSLTVNPINLVATIEAAIETVRLAAETKSIQLETQLDINVGYVAGDSTRLQQIIWNLLSNAVKFTSVGGRVIVRLEQVDHEAEISVSDTGKGIAPGFLPHVFDYFRQADSTTTRKFGGLGLGLAIVRHLVELHGGTIQADSPGEGLGATFTVRLPLMVNQATLSQTSPSMASSSNLKGVKVLVVDDDIDTRNFVEYLLVEAGAEVFAVASAEEALKTLIQVKPDVLLSDIGMPDMDGYMLIRQVRSLPAEQGGEIPAISLTAFAGEINQQQALAAGFQMHLAKPIEPEQIISMVASLIIH